MQKSYFNSYLPVEAYKKLKIEAVELNITIKELISTILKRHVEKNEKEKEYAEIEKKE